MMYIISDASYRVSFTWEYIWELVVCVYFYTLLLRQTFAAKTAILILQGFKKQNSYARAKQIIQQETVKIVIKPFIRLFFIFNATWVFSFSFLGEIRTTSGLGGRNCLQWMV